MHRSLLAHGWIVAGLLSLWLTPLVWAADPLVGKRVVVIKDQAPLAASGKEVAKADECTVFTVDKVDGEWLWIKSERAYIRRGDVVPFEDAIGHYTRLLETNKTANNYWNRAQIWRLKGELDIALGDMNDAIRLNSNESARFNQRGLLWHDKKEYDKAIADYSEAIRLNPKNGGAYNNRARASAGKKDYDKAIADYDEALKHIDPNEKSGVFYDSDITGGDSTAMVNLRSLTFSNRGITWKSKGNYDKAIADYEEAIRLDPMYQAPRTNRRIAWNDQKAWDKIITDCEVAIRERSTDPKLFNARGWASLQKQDYDKALADFEEAIRLDPMDQMPRRNRRVIWEKKGEWNKVIAEHDAAIQADPQNVKLVMNRASAWARKPDFEKQLADYELVIRRDLKYVEAWNGKAWLRATCPVEKYRDGKKAVEYATKACELTEWKNASYLDTLAASYAEVGNFDKAVEWQQKGMDLAPANQKSDYDSRLKLYRDKKPYRQQLAK